MRDLISSKSASLLAFIFNSIDQARELRSARVTMSKSEKPSSTMESLELFPWVAASTITWLLKAFEPEAIKERNSARRNLMEVNTYVAKVPTSLMEAIKAVEAIEAIEC